MVKITVLYGHPTNPETFEKYYAQTHLPLTARMKGVTRLELTKFLAAPDGGKPSSYRMAELYFPHQSEMEKTLASPEAQTTIADLPNFASGGVAMIIGAVEG